MSEKIRVPQLSDDENDLVNHLLGVIVQKGKRNRMRSAFYDGRRAVKFVSDVIPDQYRSLPLALGWAAKAVDGLGRRTVIEEFVSPDGPDLGALGVDELIESNFLYSELSQARTDSLLHGVSYLVTTAGVGDEPRALVHAKSALDATGDWNDRSRKLDNFLSITARKDGNVVGFDLHLPGRIISVERTQGKWSVDESRHSFGVPVDQLVYKPRTSRRRGRSRITRPVMGIQDSAVRALLRMEGHMDIYAIPQMVITGAMEDIFRNADGSLKSSLQIMMGRVLGIPDDDDPGNPNPRAQVEQFSAESPKPHIEQLNALAKLMARETSLSDSDFALTDIVNPTSEGAYVQGREDLLTEAEGATDDWDPSVNGTVRRALAIQNGLQSVPDDYRKIRAHWRDPRFTSRAQMADAGSKQVASLPWLGETSVGLELMGLTADQIERATAERRTATGRTVVEAVLNANAGADEVRDAVGVDGGTA
jgi:hypothetical protein